MNDMDNREVKTNESGTVKVNVTLAGRLYSFCVQAEDEELIRKACSMLNARMSELSHFEFKDSVDHLSTAALQCMVWFLREKKKDVSGTLMREIGFLDKQLDEYIENNIR